MSIIAASSTLRYPYEAITDKTDYLQINIFNYTASESLTESSTFGTNQGSFAIQSNLAGRSLSKKQLADNGTIILPMPSNIEDSNSVSYDGDTLNGLTAFGLNVFEGTAGADFKKLLGSPTERSNEVARLLKVPGVAAANANITADAVKDYLNKYLAASAVNIFGSNVSVNSLLARTEGKILNPNMELLFNNVTLRTFRFSFKMTPRDEVESLQVKSIIRSLKKNMAAKRADLFLETPNIFELEYKKGNKLHPFLNRFKQCALSDMSVNYTGENVYATYSDGTPISIIMNLTFKELVPIYEDDYNDDAFNTVTENDVVSRKFDDAYKKGIPQNRMVYGVTGNQQNNVEGVGY